MPDALDVTMQENVLPDTGESLNSAIETAFDKTLPAEAPPAAAPPAAVPPIEDKAVPATESRKRDEHGRFVPKESSAPGEPAPPALAPPASGAASPAPGAAAPASQPPQFGEAPQSWKPEMRPLYEKIPVELRPYLHQRETELQHGFEQVARRGSVAEAVLNEFVPYADQLQSEGATPITAMRTLLQTAHQLRTGGTEFKKAIIHSLAQQYGVDISQPVNAELARAEAMSSQLLTERMYGSAANQQQTVQQTSQEFAAFAGDPANEFFPQVRGIMALLIENNVAKDLRTAYDMAVGMDAGVRKTLIDREYQTRAQAEKSAAAANLSVKGTPGGASVRATPPGGETLRASIERAMEGS